MDIFVVMVLVFIFFSVDVMNEKLCKIDDFIIIKVMCKNILGVGFCFFVILMILIVIIK